MRRPERSSDNEYHFPKRVHDNVVQTPGRPGRFAQPYLKQDPNPGLSWTVQAGCPTCFRQFSQAVGSPSQGNAVNCFYRLHGQPLDGLYQPRDLRACMRRQGLPDTGIASISKRLQTKLEQCIPYLADCALCGIGWCAVHNRGSRGRQCVRQLAFVPLPFHSI